MEEIIMQQLTEIQSWRVTGPEIMDTDRYLSSANAPDIEEDVRLCIQSGAREMILNCAPMTYMTAAGLRAFLNMARLMRQAGGTLSVQGLNGQPRELFYASAMDTMIPVADEIGMPVIQAA